MAQAKLPAKAKTVEAAKAKNVGNRNVVDAAKSAKSSKGVKSSAGGGSADTNPRAMTAKGKGK